MHIISNQPMPIREVMMSLYYCVIHRYCMHACSLFALLGDVMYIYIYIYIWLFAATRSGYVSYRCEKEPMCFANCLWFFSIAFICFLVSDVDTSHLRRVQTLVTPKYLVGHPKPLSRFPSVWLAQIDLFVLRGIKHWLINQSINQSITYIVLNEHLLMYKCDISLAPKSLMNCDCSPLIRWFCWRRTAANNNSSRRRRRRDKTSAICIFIAHRRTQKLKLHALDVIISLTLNAPFYPYPKGKYVVTDFHIALFLFEYTLTNQHHHVIRNLANGLHGIAAYKTPLRRVEWTSPVRRWAFPIVLHLPLFPTHCSTE